MPTIITDLSQLDPNGTYSYADYLTWRFTEWVQLIKGKFQRPVAGAGQLHLLPTTEPADGIMK